MADLARIDTYKMQMSYGSQRCRLVLNDSRYTHDVVALRNDAKLNRYIHHELLTEEMHDRWLSAQLGRRDALNFAILVRGAFAGTLSLYNITRDTAEFGRFILRDGIARVYAPVASLLATSFGFEILGLPELHSKVLEDNQRALSFIERIGWRRDSRYDEQVTFHGERTRVIGHSLSADAWPAVFDQDRDLLTRLLVG